MGDKDAHIRLGKCIDLLRLNGIARTQADIAKELDYSRANVSAAINGNPRYLTEPFLKRFAKVYGDYINEEWLLTGEGEMFKHREAEWVDDSETSESKVETRPRIPVDASAGFLSGIAEGVKPHECEQVPIIPGVPDYACTIVVRGDSMTPKYESGDELALVPLRDARAIQWGHVYILDTRDGVLLKRLYDNKDSIRCVSYNPEYPDSFVDKSSINSIWRVVALLRRF